MRDLRLTAGSCSWQLCCATFVLCLAIHGQLDDDAAAAAAAQSILQPAAGTFKLLYQSDLPGRRSDSVVPLLPLKTDDGETPSETAPEFYVSCSEGDDGAAGSLAAPFRSLTRARDAIRAARSQGQSTAAAETAAAVFIRGGVCQLPEPLHLNASDSGVAWPVQPKEPSCSLHRALFKHAKGQSRVTLSAGSGMRACQSRLLQEEMGLRSVPCLQERIPR